MGGRRYGLFAHDFRQVPVDALLELVTERALAQDPTPSPLTAAPPLLVLSQPEFDDLVRQALRDLRRPELLGRNQLLRIRLARDRAGDEAPGAATLEALVGAAVETLREHPRDDKLWRAVERTYVRPAATQERPPRPWGCRSAPTAATSPRALTGSTWLGPGGLRQRRAPLSTTGQLLVWKPSNAAAQPPATEEVTAMSRQTGDRAWWCSAPAWRDCWPLGCSPTATGR